MKKSAELLNPTSLPSQGKKDSSRDQAVERIRRQLLHGASGIANKAAWLIRWRAVLTLAIVVLSAILFLLIIDMLTRRDELGLRLLTTTALVGLVVAAVHQILRPAWKFRPTPVDMARWVEKVQSHPRSANRGELVTAVELAGLPPDETRFGSLGFRDAALRDWAANNPTPRWNELLDTRRLRQSAMALFAVLAAMAALFFFWPEDAQTAFMRLSLPWVSQRWPQADQLALRNPPAVVAVGSEIQLEVFDRKPPMPQTVELQVRTAGDDSQSRITKLPATPLGDMAIANLPTVEKSIEVRAIGGDDASMAWHRIDTVEPPQLVEYAFTIQPPEYAQQPEQQIVGKRISLLAGSLVEFNALFDDPVVAVDLHWIQSASARTQGNSLVNSLASSEENSGPDSQFAIDGVGSANPLFPRLGGNRRMLKIAGLQGEPVAVEQSLTWQLAITTESGLQLLQPDRWQLEVTSDRPPSVTMQSAELAQLTDQAKLPLIGRAIDDLGLVETAMCVQIEGVDTQPRRQIVWQTDVQATTPRELAIADSWMLSSDLPLQAGQYVGVWLEARDTLGQVGKSEVQRFEIQSLDDYLLSIQDRQSKLLERMRELVDAQRRNEQLTTKTQELTGSESRVTQADADVLTNVAQIQKNLTRQLSGGSASLEAEIATLLDLLAQNELGKSDLANEIRNLQSRMSQLAQQELKRASEMSERASTNAAQALADGGKLDDALSRSLEASAEAQQEALRELESLADRLGRSELLQQVQRELSKIGSQQNALRRETDQLQLDRLSQPDGSDNLRSRRTALAADQQSLARRLDDLVKRARDLGAAADESQQGLQSQIESATDTLTRQQASSQMRRATEELRSEQFAASASTQQQVSETLSAALEQLGGRTRTQSGNLQNQARDLRASSQSLAELAQRQMQLAEQACVEATNAAAAAASQTDQRLQLELRRETAAQSEQLASAGDAPSAAEVDLAVQSQVEALSAREQGSLEQAKSSGMQAAEQLKQTADNLAERAERLQRELQKTQLNELADAIVELRAQQQTVTTTFVEFSSKALAEPDSEISEASVRNSTSKQEAVRQMVRDVRKQTTQLPTFDWTLEQAESAMGRTVAAAQRSRLTPDASDAAEQALRMLDLAANALARSTESDTTSANQSETGQEQQRDESSEENSSSRPLPALASLRLLRSWQQELNIQTSQAEAETNQAARSQQLARLATTQAALGRQMEQLLEALAESSAQ